MRKRFGFAAVGFILGIVAVLVTPSYAYNRYQDGCNAASCHSAFTGSVSPKGSTFPSGDKHRMHRSTSYMAAECDLCHSSNDSNNPWIGSSSGFPPTVPGVGCTGCHVGSGLRKHHQANGVSTCYSTGCHASQSGEVPPPESQNPPYYGLTAYSQVKEPCNPVATTNLNENWTTNCCEGSDTDGDNAYDGNDTDCGAAATPGEAGALQVTAYDKGTGTITVSFGAGCATSNNNVEYGPIASLATYGYSGQVCTIGNSGSSSFQVPTGSFFLVVGNDGTKEGSYGTRRSGATVTERPEDAAIATCPIPQDLTLRCD